MKETFNENLYHTYHGSDEFTNRKANVRKNENGWYVELYLNSTLWETREAYNHSETYSENIAENWVLGIIEPE